MCFYPVYRVMSGFVYLFSPLYIRLWNPPLRLQSADLEIKSTHARIHKVADSSNTHM